VLREINPFNNGDSELHKQTTYQLSVFKRILKAVAARWQGRDSYYNARIVWDKDNGRPPLDYLMQEWPGLPVMLGAIRPKQITLHQLIGDNFKKLQIWQELCRVQQSYSGWSAHGVVFDVHGDGIPDLVLHTLGEVPSRFTITRTEDDTRLYICEFSALLSRLSEFNPQP